LGHTLAGAVLTDVPLLVKELEPELPGYIPIISRLARKITGVTPVLVRLFVECLVFEWFLMDLRATVLLGPRADGIRQAMADYIMKAPHRSGIQPDDVSRDVFEGLQVERFAEYHRALKGTKLDWKTLKGTKRDWEALAKVAWERMGGPRFSNSIAHARLINHTAFLFKLCDEFCSEVE
jgi:hypothetical protein